MMFVRLVPKMWPKWRATPIYSQKDDKGRTHKITLSLSKQKETDTTGKN